MWSCFKAKSDIRKHLKKAQRFWGCKTFDCNVICVESISKQIRILGSIWKRHPKILGLKHICQVGCNNNNYNLCGKYFKTNSDIKKHLNKILRLQHICQVCCNNNTKCVNCVFHMDNHIYWDCNVIYVESTSRRN